MCEYLIHQLSSAEVSWQKLKHRYGTSGSLLSGEVETVTQQRKHYTNVYNCALAKSEQARIHMNIYMLQFFYSLNNNQEAVLRLLNNG